MSPLHPDWRPTRDQKGLLMGLWLLLAFVNGMLLTFNTSLWMNSMSDDTWLLFLNFVSLVACVHMYARCKYMDTREEDDDDS